MFHQIRAADPIPMSAEEVIDLALKKGANEGIAALSGVERKVWLISEAEITCDMDGIDSFLDRYAVVLPEIVDAFSVIGATEISERLRSIYAA